MASTIPKPPQQSIMSLSKNYLSSTPKSKVTMISQLNAKLFMGRSPPKVNTYQSSQHQFMNVQSNSHSARSNQRQQQSIISNQAPGPFNPGQTDAKIKVGNASSQLQSMMANNSSQRSNQKERQQKEIPSVQLQIQLPQQQGGMRIFNGAFNMNCLTTKSPQFILTSLTSTVLPSLNMQFAQFSEYGLICQRDSDALKLEIELQLYEGTDFLYVIRLKHLSQSEIVSSEEDHAFKQLSANILQALQL
ncbi:hypothetical protein FGO68_gene7530 [Halteria grandinella]|uniref:Uncharacterized protein n=1 Tax=Halteria grandinella TaxID=5974 RepID=A0A8J8N933_HALGN|nr:hypothetical protein FGO68_gene7530 [Halteria grandinella]